MKPFTLFLCLTGIGMGFFTGPARASDDNDAGLLSQAENLETKGDYEGSLPLWRTGLADYIDRHDVEGEMRASIGLANVLDQLGDSRSAEDVLEKAAQVAKTASDKALESRIDSSLGEIYMLCPNPDDAQGLLTKGVTLARGTGSPALIASALNNLAIYHTYTKNYSQSVTEYSEAKDEAHKAGDLKLQCRIEANLLVAAVQNADWDTVTKWCNELEAGQDHIPDSHEKAMALIGAGRGELACFQRQSDDDDALRLKAFHDYQAAEKIATRLSDSRALTYALGYQGELYALENRSDDALALTCHAAIIAQDLKSPDILFRWQWQIAKILKATGKQDEAITAYTTAISTLQGVRHDMAMHYGNISYGSSFREAAGAAYYQLADLLLQKAVATSSDQEQQAIYAEARNTIEELKTAELEDYFQDDCANLLRARKQSVETFSSSALVVYIIPLDDRTEILTSLSTGRIERARSDATAQQLEDTANAFRLNLENRASYEYLEQAAQLYDWLIRPIQSIIDKSKIDTLVFIPDGALRTIPMSALYDGEHYLVEKYAIATTPGLSLMDAKPLIAGKSSLIVNALSQGVQGYDALTYAQGEADKIKSIYGATELSNQDFTKANVEKEFEKENYSIVHIASHGHFDRDVRNTYILTYDGKLSLNEMEDMIKPSGIKDQPVELLTLSACQTAAGDDRAALGLAGVAVKAGARSAFATLWFVNDEASEIIVANFYANLHNIPGITKAQALRQAQVKLLNDPHYGHPCFWAPYLIIGNWL